MDIKLYDCKTARDASKEWGVSERRVLMFIAAGRINGAVKTGNLWLIPEDAEKPADARVNNHCHIIKREAVNEK